MMRLSRYEDSAPAPTGRYADAIAALQEAIAVIDRPGEGLGCAFGLRPGEWGHLKVVHARDQLVALRDAMERYDQGIADR